MRKLIFVLTLIATPALAATDYTCVSQCTSQGMQYQFCVSKCSFNQTPDYSRRVDYTCVSQCTAQGKQYAYCTQACSY